MEDNYKVLVNGLQNGLNKNLDMSQELVNICNSFYNKPVNNIQQMRNRNTKIKGDLFECFSKLYLQSVMGFPYVWLYQEIPNDLKKELNLTKQDVGIDIIAKDKYGKYYAIQAKYRNRDKNNGKKISLSWSTLSTFYALVSRTGPFEKYIVITTADYIRRMGKKNNKDVSVGFNKIKKMTHFEWLDLCNMYLNNKPQNQNSIQYDLEDIRKKRLQYFENIT